MIAKLPPEIADAFPARPAGMHKYAAGTVAVVGGSRDFINAPVIAGLGARGAGAGLVRLVVPDASRVAASVMIPEAVFTKLTPVCSYPSADATVAGMGIGTGPASGAMVTKLLSGAAGRYVLDADALTLLAGWYAAGGRSYNHSVDQRLVLTPHVAEAARLLACSVAEVEADRPGAAREIASRYRATTVLKGAGTVVADEGSGETWVCEAGNPFMALGGMGDLLAGMIAARWAHLAKRRPEAGEDVNRTLAARSATWLHAVAADSLVAAEPPKEPCVAAVAAAAASMRISFELGRRA